MIVVREVKQRAREQGGEQGSVGKSKETSLSMGHLSRARLRQSQGKRAGKPSGSIIKDSKDQIWVECRMY